MTMVNRKGFRKCAMGFFTGAALLASAFPAYAKTEAANEMAFYNVSMAQKLVEDGIISQSSADSIEEYMKANRPERLEDGAGTRGGFLGDAVSDGVIDQDTADKLKEYMKEKMEERKGQAGLGEDSANGRQGRWNGMWNDLLTAGVITQAEYDAILASIPQRAAGVGDGAE